VVIRYQAHVMQVEIFCFFILVGVSRKKTKNPEGYLLADLGGETV
jgi:hypothetical protein